jgi:hypothetical protein
VGRLLLADPHGEPYAVSRSRNGTASKASGPSTPAPFHVPVASSSSAATGLIAVLPDDGLGAVVAHRVGVVDDVVEVDLAGVAVGADALHPGAGAGLAAHAVTERRRIGKARRDDVAR